MHVPQPFVFASSRLAIVLLVFSAGILHAQTTLDPTFNAVPSELLTTNSAVKQIVQPDGKVIVFGIKSVVDGLVKGDIARLNADGSVDTSFHYCSCGLTFVSSVRLQSDGRMVVGGSDPGFARMIRVNSDGSIDSSYATSVAGPPPFAGGSSFIVEAIQPDGKVLATITSSSFGHSGFSLRRYNTDGSLDNGFAEIPLASGSPASANVSIAFAGEGKFFLGVTNFFGSGSTASVRRRNSDGSIDSGWEAPSFSGSGFPGSTTIGEISASPDGSLLVAGRWDTVNGVDKKNLVRILPAGNVDVTFNVPPGLWGTGVYRQADGKILFSSVVEISNISKLFRLNADGTVDGTFMMDPVVTSIQNRWVVDASGRILFFGPTVDGVRIVRLLANGSRDATYAPNLTGFSQVQVSAAQTDGKVVLAGNFTHVDGVARRSVARLNADGSLDASFNAGGGFDALQLALYSMFVQPDGKIVIAGSFGSYDGALVPGLVRINQNGTIDNSFVVTGNPRPFVAALQADGKILIGGNFLTVNGSSRTGIARLNSADGSLDNTFNPTIGNPNIRSLVVQPDGKILIAGSFSGVNGFNRSNMARLNLADGSLDQSFTANTAAVVSGAYLQPDGKYVILTGSNGTAIARRNVDGSADAGFTPPTFFQSTGATMSLFTLYVQSDGGILVGGGFDTVSTSVANTTRRNLTRLFPNGTHDVLFMPSGANGLVRSLVRYSSDKVIVSGDFSSVGGVLRPGNARLTLGAIRARTLFDFNGDGRADFTVYRPSSGIWYELYSDGSPYGSPTFGIAGDIPVPADFDGDGITDEAIFRPSSGDWWYWSSVTGGYANVTFGQNGDIARPFDFDGDGKADFVVYRPSDQKWYRTGTLGTLTPPFSFGAPGDQPVTGDFDGDGKGDIAIFRPSTGEWWYAASSAGMAFRSAHWGQLGDIPVPADYDGDGKTDVAVFRPSNGGWYIFKSSDSSWYAFGFGTSGDRPVPADYDGDGRADAAVFRPSEGIWYLLQSTAGTGGVQWGAATDVAIPNAFLN